MTSSVAHPFRTHTCGVLRLEHMGQHVRLSGWVDRKRHHGQVLFIDLRDHDGITQCVIDPQKDHAFNICTSATLESVLCITGKVIRREGAAVNDKLPTGHIEISIESAEILSKVTKTLPIQVNSAQIFPEETRLKYRFLDLRRRDLHDRITLRANVVHALRVEMVERGFLEIHTPILTASSPEGANDYLVPARLHPGKFYALPQAPQQFKQLLMTSGFDKYFQIAPCFRDEAGRANRSPGEFYQLDFEMAYVTQEDVFAVLEPVMFNIFQKFAPHSEVSLAPFQRIDYYDAINRFGSDKPDLRNPLIIHNVRDIFVESSFKAFADDVREKNYDVRAIVLPNATQQPRRFFDEIQAWAQKEHQLPGVGYLLCHHTEWSASDALRGPLAKFLSETLRQKMANQLNLRANDGVFFICHDAKNSARLAGHLRHYLAHACHLIQENSYHFCWVINFPLYEKCEETGKIQFAHNPFSMPQGGMDALNTRDPLDVRAFQYDLVCNGMELASGAIRNHHVSIMQRAFEIAGYPLEYVHQTFGAMMDAFSYGAPPHGGAAPGVDRMVMLLSHQSSIREVIAFPMNQNAEDILMNAPASVDENRLKDLHIQVLPRSEKQN